jgi:hypothetical protein
MGIRSRRASFRDFVEAEMPCLLELATTVSPGADEAGALTEEALVRVGLAWRRIAATGDPAASARAVLLRLHSERAGGVRPPRPGRDDRKAAQDRARLAAESRDRTDVAAASASIMARLRRRRRTRLLLHSCLSGLLATLAVLVALALPHDDGSAVVVAPVQRVPVTADIVPYGFQLKMSLRFDTMRTIDRGEFVVGDRSWQASFFDTSGTDLDLPAMPLLARAGDEVDVTAKDFSPPCGSDSPAPVVRVYATVVYGSPVVTRYTVANPAVYRAAVRAWCRRPMYATRLGTSRGGAGRTTISILLSNPGDHPLRVTSGALRAGVTRWQPAAVTVPPQGQATLQVHVSGYHPGRSPTPWSRGLLTVGGNSLRLAR